MIEELEDEIFTVESEIERIKSFEIDLTDTTPEKLQILKGQTAVFLNQIKYYRMTLQNLSQD